MTSCLFNKARNLSNFPSRCNKNRTERKDTLRFAAMDIAAGDALGIHIKLVQYGVSENACIFLFCCVFVPENPACASIRWRPRLYGGPDPFIWRKIIDRQKRWYKHDADVRLVITPDFGPHPLAANPLPRLTWYDKLSDRRWLEDHGVDEMPRLLASFSEPHELLTLMPRLPSSWVLKPAGAADSFGVTVDRGGSDVTRGGVLLDVYSTWSGSSPRSTAWLLSSGL